MKQKVILLLIVFLFPFITNAAELSVSDLMLISNSSTSNVINEPKVEDLNINLDYSLKKENDFITYSFVVHNISDEDYKIAIQGNNSSHLDYKINTNEIARNGDTRIEFTTTYQNVDMLTNPKVENNTLNIALIPTLNNKSSNGTLIYGIMAITLIGFSIIIIAFNKKLWFTIPVVGSLLYFIVPTSFAEPLITITNNVYLEANKYCNSFQTDDWDQIARNIKIDNISCYNVGDEKEITLTNNELSKVRIVNMTTDCEESASCGFVFEFVTPIGVVPFNETESATYKDSTIRYYLRNTVLDLMPISLKEILAPTKITEVIDDQEESYNDELYLISKDNTLEYYQNGESKIKYYKEQPVSWWTRTSNQNKASAILENGNIGLINQNESLGLAPLFKLK